MLRSLLVALDGSPHSDAAAALACDWGRRFGARLLGLGVLDQPSIEHGEPVPMGAYAYKKQRDEARMLDAHQRLLAFLTDFRARCAAAGVETTLVEDVGDPGEQIVREAQRCDIVVVGRETHFRFETQDRPDATLAAMIRSSSRPVVVVPREPTEGTGILVAYGGGREAARTLQTFESLGLAQGDMIDVMTVHPDRAEGEAIAGLAGAFLTAHGAPHHLHTIVTASPPAEILLEEVRRRSPRLLVIGAHAHHPVRDLFTTSVTRAVLGGCAIPVVVGS